MKIKKSKTTNFILLSLYRQLSICQILFPCCFQAVIPCWYLGPPTLLSQLFRLVLLLNFTVFRPLSLLFMWHKYLKIGNCVYAVWKNIGILKPNKYMNSSGILCVKAYFFYLLLGIVSQFFVFQPMSSHCFLFFYRCFVHCFLFPYRCVLRNARPPFPCSPANVSSPGSLVSNKCFSPASLYYSQCFLLCHLFSS